MTKFYTSDLHFGHTKIIEYEHRPWNTVEEMDEGLIENWNRKVKKGDLVYILGDFTMRVKEKEIAPILKLLNGQKVLVKGNHCYFSREKWAKKYFTEICDYKEIYDNGEKVILCHYPILSWNRQAYGSIHLYGHVHTSYAHQHPHPNAFNVGVDVNDYEPKTLEELKKREEAAAQ